MDPSVPKSTHPVLIFQFPFPKTKKIALQHIFRTDDPITKENLSKTSSIRDEFFNALEVGNSSSILTTCERYLPQLFGLVVSVEENQKLRLNSPLTFQWTSSFSDKSKNYYTCYTYRFEVIMTLVTYALAQINKAGEVIETTSDDSFDENSKRAATFLRTAAGVLDYLASREIPRWVELPAERPVEVSIPVCQALSQYACATAQSITIKKGLIGNTSRQTLAKLSVDTWNKYEATENIFKALPSYKDMPSNWKIFLTFQKALAKANSYKYMGETQYAAHQYGNAVAYLDVAGKELSSAYTPGLYSTLAKYKPEIEASKEDIEHVMRSYNNENNNIYYQKTPDASSLEIVEAKSLITPIGWVPPEPAFKEIV